MVTTQTIDTKTTIILRPNRSATWQEVKWVMAVISIFVLAVAIAWSFVGAWFVLPFAGLEVGLFAYFMYRVCLNCHEKQVITIVDNTITVESGIKTPSFHWEFSRPDTHLAVTQPETEFDKHHLVLSDEVMSIQLGKFLNRQDCILARHCLKQAGLMEVSNKWWKH